MSSEIFHKTIDSTIDSIDSKTIDSIDSYFMHLHESDCVIYLNPRKDDERSLRVLSLRAHSPTFQFTPASTKSSASNTNRLSKATSKITVEGDKKKKMEERKGSLKRREGKSSIDILSIIDMDHSFVLDHLNGASTSLRGIKEAFRKGLIPQVIEACIRDTNMAVLCSLCRQCSYQNRWNLSLSQCVLPHLTLLLCSIHRELRACGISALSSILNAVGSLVNTMTRNGVPNEIGVDIAAEDRMKMCNSIQKELVLIQLRENDMMKVMSDDERSQLSAILAIFPG